MTKPSLTFFCEMESQPLEELFHSGRVIKDLHLLEAGLSLGLLDFSPQRATVVKKLNHTAIPVTAWILLPREKGYWTSLDTIAETASRYEEFRKWQIQHKLEFVAVGLDIEPRLEVMAGFASRPLNQVATLTRRLLHSPAYAQSLGQARELVQKIQEDGFLVETYQFPTVIDERTVHSNVLGRALGIPPLDADREVLMLYSSFFPSYPDAILWSYAQQCHAVGVGSTGGGVSIEGVPALKTLRWIEFKRDLLLASQAARRLYVFSLEGCVEHGYLDRLLDLDWDLQVIPPERHALGISLIRKLGQGLLWSLSHPLEALLGMLILRKLLHWLFHPSMKRD